MDHQFSSVQSLSHVWLFVTHRLQHASLPYLSPAPVVYSNSCPLSRWCHPTISSSIIPFSSSLQSFLASGSLLMSQFFSPCSGSVTQLCPTLCDHKNHNMPGLHVHHQLLKFTQTHVHWLSDAIQPSHPLSSPSPPAFNLSQHQGLFQMSQLFASGGQSIEVSASTSVLLMNTQDWSPLGWTSWISLQSKGTLKSLLQHHSSEASILQRSAFFIVQLSHS